MKQLPRPPEIDIDFLVEQIDRAKAGRPIADYDFARMSSEFEDFCVRLRDARRAREFQLRILSAEVDRPPELYRWDLLNRAPSLVDHPDYAPILAAMRTCEQNARGLAECIRELHITRQHQRGECGCCEPMPHPGD